ncbi:MAG: 5'/3'-nucleotidase SurE [Gammaproteobacteria bacterium]|nr:5'/3'-nucleotidase SurE [Gammaproteobacteria bacterium]
MHILVSNDDGVSAQGLMTLVEHLSDLAKITVVAPDRNRSGASHSLTLARPIKANTLENGYISVDGTPTDCVHLAITGLLEKEPDMVVSGINAGANLGDDVLYSGTVAAAIEGRFLGLPAIALSLASCSMKNIDCAARVASTIVQQIRNKPLAADTILNINVPDCSWDELQGFSATRLGFRHKAEPVVKAKSPRGETIYWVGPPGPEQDAGPGTDFYAIKNNCVSITPLQVDMTRHHSLETLQEWLNDC